jgi:hypothetical protein
VDRQEPSKFAPIAHRIPHSRPNSERMTEFIIVLNSKSAVRTFMSAGSLTLCVSPSQWPQTGLF